MLISVLLDIRMRSEHMFRSNPFFELGFSEISKFESRLEKSEIFLVSVFSNFS